MKTLMRAERTTFASAMTAGGSEIGGNRLCADDGFIPSTGTASCLNSWSVSAR